MKPMHQIRLNNIQKLLLEAGSQKEMVRVTGKSQSYISQILIGKNKNIGYKTARELDAAFNKPNGWLDCNFDNPSDDKIAEMQEQQILQLTEMSEQSILQYLLICKRENACPITNLDIYDFNAGSWYVEPGGLFRGSWS